MNLRTELSPGDIGQITYLHGWLYAHEYGWDARFEAYVAETLAAFCKHYDPNAERVWIAEQGGELAGCIGIARVDDEVAQLRWFLVHPKARGSGLGRRLLQEALDFCRTAGYRRIILWTVSELAAAAHLYAAFGFQRVESVASNHWGKPVTEERYELALIP